MNNWVWCVATVNERDAYVYNAVGIWRNFFLVQLNDFHKQFEDLHIFIFEQFIRFDGRFLEADESVIFAEHFADSQIWKMKMIYSSIEEFIERFTVHIAQPTNFTVRDDVVEILGDGVNCNRSTLWILCTDGSFQLLQSQYKLVRHFITSTINTQATYEPLAALSCF